MNTEQNYVGGGDYATQSTQMDATTPETPITPYDWRDSALEQITAESSDKAALFELLASNRELNETIDPTGFISEIFSFWVTKVDSGTLVERTHEIALLVNHLANLTKLRENYLCFNTWSHYADVVDNIEKGGEVDDE